MLHSLRHPLFHSTLHNRADASAQPGALFAAGAVCGGSRATSVSVFTSECNVAKHRHL